MSDDFHGLAVEVPDRQEILARLRERWALVHGGADEPAAWSPRISWPVPLTWPPASDWRVAQYGYAFLPDLPGLREAERVAAPWVRVVYGPRSAELQPLGGALTLLGSQVYQTLEPAHTGLYVEAYEIHRALHRELRASWIERHLRRRRVDGRIRPLYRLWAEHNTRLVEEFAADHADFFRWLRDGRA